MIDSDSRVNAMLVEDEKNQGPEKKLRERKTKEQILAEVDEERKKVEAAFKRKMAKLDAKEKRISLTAEERKKEKRRVEDHCKIMAGVIALGLCKQGKEFFSEENFKNALFAQLTEPQQIKFLKRYFPEVK